MKLTLEAIRAMSPGQRLGDHDPRSRGLEIRRRATGWYWYFYYRNRAGMQRRPSLGEWPRVPLDTAREIARDMARAVARGEDPSGERQEARAAGTVQTLCCDFVRDVVVPRPYSTAHVEMIATTISRYLAPALGRMAVNDVGVADAARCLAAVKGDTMRNRVRAIASKIFSYAERSGARTRSPDTDPRVKINPFLATEKSRERKRRRHITADEFARLSHEFRALAHARPARAAALLVLLMSGGRKMEILGARRADLVGSVLMLADHKTAGHTGDVRSIRLPRQAMDIIARLPAVHGSLWGPDVTKQTVRETWEAMRQAAGCADLQMRDFRRTFASAAKSAGAGLDQIGELLDHTNPQTTSRYAFLFDDARDRLTQGTADAIEERLGGLPLIEPEPPAK